MQYPEFYPRCERADKRRKKPSTQTSVFAGAIMLAGDAQLLHRAFNNLVTNAIHYTASGWIEIRIDGGSQAIWICDSGQGIPAAELPFIFDRFYRGVNHGRPGGSGMGLAITKEIFDLHGWKIQAESETGKGTCLQVTWTN